MKITGNIYDRLVNQLSKEMPVGTMIQFALANTLIHSLWCGLLSQRMINRKEPKFKDEDVEQLQRAILKAYDTIAEHRDLRLEKSPVIGYDLLDALRLSLLNYEFLLE